VLNAVYEVDFRGFSYGFRPGRGPHDALDALAMGIERKRVNWVLDADIRNFFGQIDHSWLRRFIEHRIADKRIWQLIGKWLAAGVIEDEQWSACEEGSPQGASASPLLANVYLHYVLDLWVDWWRRHRADGDVIIVRFADDFTVGFQYEEDARRFRDELHQRLAKFGLELHPDKTRLIEFGRRAAIDRERRGLGKPETFDFLGFTHMCARTRGGRFWVRRITIAKRMRAKLAEVKEQLRRRMHIPIPVQGRWLAQVLQGHMAYYAVPKRRRGIGLPSPGDPALAQGAQPPKPAWTGSLATDGPDRDSMAPKGPGDASLPERALHSQNLRQEPSAVVPHAGIRAGGRP
jgi:RNA-directed DNA polymerase